MKPNSISFMSTRERRPLSYIITPAEKRIKFTVFLESLSRLVYVLKKKEKEEEEEEGEVVRLEREEIQ